MKKFFIIAGEASGDMLGSKLIKELKKKSPDAEFVGVGGELMQEQGLQSIFDYRDLSIMGFFEILPQLPKILARIKETKDAIKKLNPDYLITIDSPDFCFRVAKEFQNDKKIKKIHLIAPSVWAYREGRAKKIAEIYDLLLTILPFEPPYFTKYGLETKFIGHPITEIAISDEEKKENDFNFRKEHEISQDTILITLTPGSRLSEIKKIFPEFIKAINLLNKSHKNIKVIIPLISKTKNLVTQMAKSLKLDYILVQNSEKIKALSASNLALAKSGTNNVELSIFKIPMVIAYKVNFLTYILGRILIKVKFINLINLILNKGVIPEMIQENCNANKLCHELDKLIIDKKLANKQIRESKSALKLMGLEYKEKPAKKAAAQIMKL